MDQEPKRQRAWWEWALIVFGVLVVAVGGLCLLIIVQINSQY